MGKLENAYLVHTIVPNNNVTEETGESTLNAKTVTTKDDIKARRIIYLHISEEIWEKPLNYLNAHYCETEEEETTTLDGKISNEESTTLNGEISIEGYTTTTETIANNEKEYEKVKKEEKENETTTLKSEIPTEKTLAINMESFLIEENTKYSIIEKNENKLLIDYARSTTETEFNATTDFIKNLYGDFAFVMNYIKKVFINILHINSNDMLTDIVTKKTKVESNEKESKQTDKHLFNCITNTFNELLEKYDLKEFKFIHKIREGLNVI
ncbi:hypothetical protein H8356DRAFT_1424097 [Neocallimastix lanati (nom. inval.)]|nr:hypothetical protein H8356DRAFT_1424097 [Neocallimastix sp. JGI-2020a]